ncbi:MAG: hypothetical protein GPJ06_05870 [Microcystis aeruginosa G13-11]|nr:hypothetical protein [Microcystis aeruginosa G13-11]
MRWFWVALGAFLAIIGEEFLRKLLALSLCGVFLLSYCLPDAKYSASVVAQTPQPAIGQSQTEQKIDNYFSPIQPDGTPKLGIDRWWATAGVDKEITVNWTVEVKEKGEYYLRLGVDLENFDVINRFRKWKLSDKVSIKISDDYNRPVSSYEASGYDDKISIRFREPGIYQITIDKFVVPREAVVEEIEFKLNKLHKGELGEDIYLKTFFIADRPEVTIKNFRIKVPDSQNKVIDRRELTKQGLINYFTPILNFEPEEEYQVPFDVNKNTWKAETKATIKDRGNANDYLDLSQFKTDIKGAYSRSKKTPAKIYASIVENDNLEIDNKKTGIKELAINYYFHYPHSNWYDHEGFNNHEGDWEGITVFLQKDRDGYYYPCRVAFGEHIFLVSEFISEGGEIFEWTELVKDNNILFSTNLGSPNDILAQSNVFVGLGGHASYPKSGISELSICTKFKIPTSIDPSCEEKHQGGKIYNLHDNLSLISSSDPKSREVVEYLPRVGVEKIEDLGDKSWLLYPGTWGNPKNCITRLPLDIGCPSAPRGPAFLDLKKISGISQPISIIAGPTWESFGLGERWLNPWEWSKEFKGADKLKGCPPPQEEPKPEPTPDIPRKPDGNTGIIYGDPHIVTFDGLRNSFQAVGEFILAKSERGDFEVQGRFKGVGDNASLPSAVAIKAGGERIGIYQGKLQINARNVNEASLPIILEGGARVDKNGAEYRIIAPTGEWVEVSGSSVLTIKVTVPKSRISKMYGLLGNYNNIPNDDLKTRQGKVVGINPNYDQLYKEYGNSWRIPQPESLFAYEVGETSATFTNLNFPKKVLTLADFTTQQKQEAERVCRSAGVTSSAMLESCMFDVLVTGDRSFANVSAYVQSEVKVTATVTPTESPKPQPSASNNGSINGKWIGKYTCAQGITGVTLTINQKGTEIAAEFELYPLPENPNLPRGAYSLNGTFNPNTLEMNLKAAKWLKRPGATWVVVDFSGQFDSNLNRFTGRMKHPSCGSIELVRATSNNSQQPPNNKPTSTQQTQASCQATVDKILQEIRSKGVRRVEFSISKGTANNGMTGNPTSRTDELTVALFNDNPKKADPIIENIMNSLKLLNSWADQIVKSCNNTATVAFDVKGSTDVIGFHGWEWKFYIQSNEKTTKREMCIQTNDGTATPYSWGVLRNQPLCGY